MSASDEVINGWRECADPVELAAAVAAGVEVQVGDFERSVCTTAEDFADCMSGGSTYRLPSSWSWSPEPPAPVTGDDLRERIARAAACAYMRVPVEAMDPRIIIEPMWPEVADAVLAVLPPQPADEGAGPSGPPWCLALDVWMALGGDSNAFEAWAHHEDDRRTWGDAWAQIVAAVEGSRMEGDTNPPPGTILDLPSYQWVRDTPAPPWPGAVLSGLTDEDGEATWLAQAGQVRGEAVRLRHRDAEVHMSPAEARALAAALAHYATEADR